MVHGLAQIALWLPSTLLAMSAATAANMNVTAPIVNLGYAQYQGYFDAQTNLTNFLSIRYAAPPLGEHHIDIAAIEPNVVVMLIYKISRSGNLRFQAPQPPLPESGVQPAMQNPNMCYQATFGTNTMAPVSPYGYNKRQSATPASSEDCLFLNVFVPGTMPAEPVTTGGLPVLVWIHGGGYEGGYAAKYNGANLVADSLNTVVVVVIQYRLGAFGKTSHSETSTISSVCLILALGFLSGNEVEAQGVLNAGLLDQTFALQWVQDYIGLFGGDKAHVTIWGESAGAGSVLQHIVANGGNTQPPLFNAAITSSTFLPSQYNYNDRVPQLMYDEVVAMTGCASSADTFTCLQSVEADILQNANYYLVDSAFFGTFVFVPVVDGTFILERPTVTLAKGQVNGVRAHLHYIFQMLTFLKQVLLSVCNQNEGNVFVNVNETLTITDYISQLFPDMTSLQVQEAASVYEDYGTPLEQAITVMGDSIFVCPTYYLLQAFAGRSWKGLFAVPPAYHGYDIVYYFNMYAPSSSPPNAFSICDPCYHVSPGYPPSYNNTQFITAFTQSFMSLAKYYDVNTKLIRPTSRPTGTNITSERRR
ncbi:Alpha/Beta hydrolase protein [Lanmaoa asiatica]|nr:Alpha/Beta hydrolase protein [Lanmaoa asiatica]